MISNTLVETLIKRDLPSGLPKLDEVSTAPAGLAVNLYKDKVHRIFSGVPPFVDEKVISKAQQGFLAVHNPKALHKLASKMTKKDWKKLPKRKKRKAMKETSFMEMYGQPAMTAVDKKREAERAATDKKAETIATKLMAKISDEDMTAMAKRAMDKLTHDLTGPDSDMSMWDVKDKMRHKMSMGVMDKMANMESTTEAFKNPKARGAFFAKLADSGKYRRPAKSGRKTKMIGPNLAPIRGALFNVNKLLGDISAVQRGKVVQRVRRRVAGRFAIKGVRKVVK